MNDDATGEACSARTASDASDASADWFSLGPLAALPDQRACWKRAGAEHLAAVRVGETVHVLSNTCPHQGASLAGGRVAGGKLHCPAHGLGFDLRTGHMGTSGLAVPCFATEIREGEVWVCVPLPSPSPSTTCSAPPSTPRSTPRTAP